MKRIVVVGGSIAAVTAAEALRLEGFDGSITVLSQEKNPPYTRVPLSKGVLAGREHPDDVALPALSSDIDLCLGVQAAELDVDGRQVRASSETFGWDGLVIATGARARRLAPELDELVVRDVGDCLTLREEAASASTVAIVGGGFLGMEIASTLIGMGKAVTVLDREPVMRRLVGATVADRIEDVARAAGVAFHIDPGGVSPVGEPGARPRGVRSASGRLFEADLVITAAGDVPNVEWLVGSGLDLAGGVSVDSRCRVRDDIVAAGDVASRAVNGAAPTRIPTWTNAVDQARAAARALLRGDEAPAYAPSYYSWTEQFGLDIKLSGPAAPDSELVAEPEWWSGDGALLRWGSPDAPRRVMGWNHSARPAQLKRMTRYRDALNVT